MHRIFKLNTKAISVVLGFVFALTACTSQQESLPASALPSETMVLRQQEVRIGFCPSMTETLHLLVEKYQTIDSIAYPSAGAAFAGLHNGKVDAIIVGRIANLSELTDNLRFVRQQDGLTLVSRQTGMIYYDDLPIVPIHTSEEASAIKGMLPDSTKIIYHETIAEALAQGYGEAILLRWSEVEPQFGLLIPVDKQGNKVQAFRSPHLYFLESLETQMAGIITAFMP